MKKNKVIKFKVSVFTLFFVLVASSLNAAVYTTLSNGDWDNMSNVWSLDGVHACGCQPGTTTNGNDIDVRHDVVMTSNLFVNNGSMFTVEETGSLIGPHNLTVTGAKVNLYGTVSMAKFTINGTGVVNLIGAVLTMSSRLIVEGVLNVDGGYVYMSNGNITISPAGTINTTNSGKVDAFNGNIENDGVVNICPSCCMTTRGNWKNSGSVLGTGSATSTNGNMKNTGFWSENIVWCSVGNDFGMTSPENCTDANIICGAVVLPVELSVFNVELSNDSRVVITWETVSEINNDYFKVLKSLNGSDWIEIATVSGAGTSTQTNSYLIYDYNSNFDIAYYRLVQVDFDGAETYSNIKAIAGGKMEEVTIFPNPAKIGDAKSVVITNVENAEITIFNMQGQVVYSTESNSNTLTVDLNEIQGGVYLVKILTKDGGINSQQLVVMD